MTTAGQGAERSSRARTDAGFTFIELLVALSLLAVVSFFILQSFENTRLPDQVTATANQVVTFSAFGKPDAAYTITVQNLTGTGTASMNATGGITYQAP